MRRSELFARIVEKEPGRPCIRATGIPVLKVLQHMSEGLSQDEILKKNPLLERKDLLACAAYAADLAPGSHAPELQRMLAEHFSPAGREERVKRALHALDNLRGSIKLDLETVKWIAQDPDLEEF